MAEKRDIVRHRKRLSLRFGLQTPDRLGFTEDISDHGLFIKTTNICPIGTRVHIELILPDAGAVQLIGMIRWAKKVPPQMIHLVKKSGMGVKITRFLSGEDAYRRMLGDFGAR